MSRRSLLLPVLALTGLVGCQDLPPQTTSAEATLGPIVVGDELVFADHRDDTLVAVQVAEGRILDIRRFDPNGPVATLEALPAAAGVLALSPESETLTRVALPDGAATTWVLGATFNAVTVSPDGDAALAYFVPGTKNSVFANHNELAFVDLAAATPPELAVTRRTLASLGGTPERFFVSPRIDGRRYAFILSQDHVAVLDLTRPGSVERSVPLVSLNNGGSRSPLDVAFGIDPDGTTLWGVVTTAEGNAAYALRITPDPEALDGAPFEVLLNQLAGLSPGGDVELMMLPDGRLVALLVSPSQGTATMTELRTGAARTITLGAGARHIRTYHEGDRPIAVLYDGSSSAFHILDVAAIEAKKDKAFRTRHATLPIEDLVPVPGTPLFVAMHPSSTAGVSVINADTDRITPFGTTGVVKRMHLSQPLGRLYLLTRVQSDDYVVSVDLASLHPEVALVPQGSDQLLVLEDALTVATYSPLPGGLLNLWPSNATIPEATHAAPGFLLHQALDRAAEEVSP